MEFRTIELVAREGVYEIPREGDTVRDITIRGSFVKATLNVGGGDIWESAGAAAGGETVVPYELNLIGIGAHTARLTLEAVPALSSTTVKATFVLFEDIGYRRRLADRSHSPWWIKNEVSYKIH